MQINRVLAAAALSSALAAVAAAQGCACASYAANVAVTVTEGPNNTARVDRTAVCVARGGSVTFQSDEGDVQVNFDKGTASPFASTQIRRGRGQRAGERVTQNNRDQCGRTYRYSIRLTKGGRTLVLDPEIIVEPGGEGQ